MKRKTDKKSKKRPAGALAALAIALALAVFVGVMAMNASLLHLRRATVYVQDLPDSFEDVKLLYVSDIDICGINTPARAAEAVNALKGLQPDILIVGGDYTSPSVWEVLNGGADSQKQLLCRSEFFRAIEGFEAPMGKYAFMSRDDAALGDMTATFTDHGFITLNDARSRVSIGDDAIWMVGVDSGNVAEYGRAFRSGECVLCVAGTPDDFPRIITAEARDSGPWVDLCLAGHTHGGQIRLFGRSILTLTQIEQKFLYGWTRETGVPMLTTSGLGCEGANLRLGTRSEAWLITLTNVKP